MRILVTGVRGQLGYDIKNELERRGHSCIGVDVQEMDITQKESIEETFSSMIPDAVIHCAAWTAVDAAEEEPNIAKVWSVNATGTENLAEICNKYKIKMMYISTDYVFDGQGNLPWEPECTNFHPLNVYGETKLAGEQAVELLVSSFFIVRIAWVFGINGSNFINTMLHVGKTREQISVVNDQIGTPTYTYDLARLLVDMIETEKYGYYHATNEGGYISWYDFAKEIFHQANDLGYSEYGEKELAVVPVTTEEYGISKASRPFNSRLSKTKLISSGFQPLPTWQDALHRYLLEKFKQGDV